jgi:hypothetical protein
VKPIKTPVFQEPVRSKIQPAAEGAERGADLVHYKRHAE